jgi:secondary thiamine-phosphate synthase enzyme
MEVVDEQAEVILAIFRETEGEPLMRIAVAEHAHAVLRAEIETVDLQARRGRPRRRFATVDLGGELPESQANPGADDRGGSAARRSTQIDPRRPRMKSMTVFTDYLFFNTKKRQEFIRITDEVAGIVQKSGVREGMALVSAMHITAGVYVNDWEDGLIHDFQEWLEKLAPSGLNYRHHQTGEDNADAHLKRTVMGHQVILPITNGKLDLGPWEQVFYAEFDGQRRKRVVVKVMGE